MQQHPEFRQIFENARLKPVSEKKGRFALDDANTLAPGSFDPADSAVLTRLTVASLHQWCDDDALADSETSADRLQALFVGIADENQNGELDEAEYSILDFVLNTAWDYLSSIGASDDDLDLLLNNWDSDAGDRMRDLLCSSLPDGEDASGADIDDFTPGASQEALFDAAAYRKRAAVRDGQKVFVKTRISGSVVLSAKQKVAIAKARLRSHSATAIARRKKSLANRKKFGLT